MFFLKSINPSLKISLIIFAFLFSCDKPYDEIIDYQYSNYQVEKITLADNFSYSQSDSLLNVSITIKNSESVEKVYSNLKLVENNSYIYQNIELTKNSTSVNSEYSTKIKMSKKFSSGKYVVEFFVKDKINQTTRKIAEHLFLYDNKQVNYPPVISDLKIPTVVSRGVPFTFSIKVDDPNGLIDISQVTFKLFRPDGSVVIPNASTPNIDYFLMVDNGDSNFGDEKSNDGIFSFKNSFGESSAIGIWKFMFQAKDKSGALSNTINANVEVR
ncbi:MAG: hypothetical protein N2321_06295 [Melioribacteraceae bacterium]|nr:hypothetical protein [Melioribacteraceae bacterium]